MSSMTSSRSVRGVTLVELMVAMLLGLLVSAGVISVFMSMSSSNSAQTQMARLQEEGRFAVQRLTDDLNMVNAQYCSSTGGVANTTSSGVFLDGLRTPMVYAKTFSPLHNTTPWGSPYPAEPAEPYPLPSFFFMRGYDCNTATCTPTAPTEVPAMGTDIGNRVLGAAVLTVRYLDSAQGWALGGASTMTSVNGEITDVSISPATGEPPLTDFKAGDLGMVADCSNATLFAVTGNGNFKPDAGNNLAVPRAVRLTDQAAPKFFDFTRAFRTVTYYLQVVSNDGTANGTKTGALMRCDNDNTDPCQEIARGVERMDFRYAVEDANGMVRYLTANEVDTASVGGASLACPPGAAKQLTPDAGCLWRAVKAVELHLLMDGQKPLYTLLEPDLAHSYRPDGITTPAAPSSSGFAVKPSDQGFDDHMMRREFNVLVMMRNYNP
jgi:type IV pilus assembly protein PilW